MKRFSGRLVSAALALALASSPAFAGRYHHHDHYRGGSASGWWIGGAVALAAAGCTWRPTRSRATRRPASAPGVAYTSPPVYAAPVYSAPVMPRPLRSTRPRRNSTRRCSINSRVPPTRLPTRPPIASAGPSTRAATTRHHLAMDHAGHGGLLQPRAGFLHEQPRLPRQLRRGRNAGGAQRRQRRPRSPRPPAARPCQGSPASSSASSRPAPHPIAAR